MIQLNSLPLSAVFLVFISQSITLTLLNQDDEARIVGGRRSIQSQWPFVAALYAVDDWFLCGGSVWDQWHIITAAHCTVFGKPISAKKVSVYLGHANIDLDSIKNLNSEYYFKVKKIIRHQLYNDNTFRFDIALLRLARPIDFAHQHIGVRCVCNPEPWEKLDLNRCMAMGWGDTYPFKNKTKLSPHLKELNMTVVEDHLCRSRKLNRHWMFCAKNPVPYHDTCQGDSGGPLVCQVKDTSPPVWSLVGLTSFGTSTCGRPNTVSYYTRVHRLLYWIEKNTQID